MTQQKPESKVTLEQVLALVAQLTPEEQDQLAQELESNWIKRALDEAEEDVRDGRVYTEEELNARLDAIEQQLLERQSK